MIGNIIGASATEAGLGKSCFSYIGNSTLILICSNDLGQVVL